MNRKKWGVCLTALALAAVMIFGAVDNMIAEGWDPQAASPTDLLAASPTDLLASSPTDLLAASPTDLLAASPTDLFAASPTDLWADAAGILDFVPGNPGDVWEWEDSLTDLSAASPTDLWADVEGILDFVPATMDDTWMWEASPARPTDFWADAEGILDFVPAVMDDMWMWEASPTDLWPASPTDLWIADTENSAGMMPSVFDTYSDPYGTVAAPVADEDIPEAPIDQDFVGLKAGQIIRMGYYEQDGDPSNLREPIEWKVISVSKRKNVALITTVYALDSVSFGTAGDEEEYREPGFNWKAAAIRQWLNDEIYEKCFTSAERQRIRLATNITKDPSGRFTTEDYVFLLSETETRRYFGTAEKMKCEPTPYALSKLGEGSAAVAADGTCRWWVRELVHAVKVNKRGEAVGPDHNEAGFVDGSKGMATFIRKRGALTYEEDAALVRPAMWIRFDEASRNN